MPRFDLIKSLREFLLRDGSRIVTGDFKLGLGVELLFDDHWDDYAHIKFDDDLWGFDFIDGYGDRLSLTAYDFHLYHNIFIHKETLLWKLKEAVTSSLMFQAYDGAHFQNLFELKSASVPYAVFHQDVRMLTDKFIDLGNALSGLPAAAAAHRGKLGFVEGAAGARDRVYQCMKSDGDAYNWIEIANGGA